MKYFGKYLDMYVNVEIAKTKKPKEKKPKEKPKRNEKSLNTVVRGTA